MNVKLKDQHDVGWTSIPGAVFVRLQGQRDSSHENSACIGSMRRNKFFAGIQVSQDL